MYTLNFKCAPLYVTQAQKRNGKNYIILCLYPSHLGSRIIVRAKPHQPEKLFPSFNSTTKISCKNVCTQSV